MTDLAAQLSALLREAEQREPHALGCPQRPEHTSGGPCTCDCTARLLAKIARATTAALRATADDTYPGELPQDWEYYVGVGAFTRALTEETKAALEARVGAPQKETEPNG